MGIVAVGRTGKKPRYPFLIDLKRIGRELLRGASIPWDLRGCEGAHREAILPSCGWRASLLLASAKQGTYVADRFQTTRWSVVLSAVRGGEGSVEALEWLCTTYWYPLYAFVRRQGHDAEAARDLTQSFFVSLLQQSALKKIDPQLGRFRAFLLASMNHFLSNERERENALKRRAEDPAFRVDLDTAERQYALEPAASLSPEELFESRWARTVLDRALRRMDEEHEATDKADLFRRLRGHLTGEEPAYDRMADDLGMTQGALRVAVHRLRRRLGTLLREEVAQTVSHPSDVDAELRSLLQAAGRGA